MTQNKETMFSFAQSLATETGIDAAAAEKVITWLMSEGVLDTPVIQDTYEEKPGFIHLATSTDLPEQAVGA